MKLSLLKTFKIIMLCVLVTETIICSTTSTNTESEGRFLLKAGFLKKKRVVSQAVPGSVHRNVAPKAEAVNLMQKSETKKAMARQDNTDKLALELGNQKPQNPNDPAPLDLNIGTGPIWVTGWVKYFKYFPSAKTQNLTPQNTPRQFSINPQFNEQYKINPKWDKKEKSKDDLGNELATNIVDKNSFYAKLVKDQVVILSSRSVRL